MLNRCGPRVGARKSCLDPRDFRTSQGLHWSVIQSYPASLAELVSVVNRSYASLIESAESRLSRVKPWGTCRKFLVSRMGSTGSTWFSKLLNSHPDILCSHERILSRIHPAREYGQEEIMELIECMAHETVHDAYRAIGDVGSVWATHLALLPSFGTGLLVRHPARSLYTRLCTFPKDQSFSVVPPQSVGIVQEIWGLNLETFEPVDQIFLHDMLTFAWQSGVLQKISVVIRIEDLKSMSYCQRTLRALTGVAFPQRLILNASRSKVNQRTTPSLTIRDIVAR